MKRKRSNQRIAPYNSNHSTQLALPSTKLNIFNFPSTVPVSIPSDSVIEEPSSSSSITTAFLIDESGQESLNEICRMPSVVPSTPSRKETSFAKEPPKLKRKPRAVDFFADRMIPKVSVPSFDLSQLQDTLKAPSHHPSSTTSSKIFTRSLAKACGVSVDSPLLEFRSKQKSNSNRARISAKSHLSFNASSSGISDPPPSTPTSRIGRSQNLHKEIQDDFHSFIDDVLSSQENLKSRLKPRNQRKISTKPERILDVPGILDDFYVHILDWSRQHILVVALTAKAYAWNELTGDVVQFFDVPSSSSAYISSVTFSHSGNLLALGDNFGLVRIFNMGSPFHSRLFGQQAYILGSPNGFSISNLAWSKKDHLAIAYSDGSLSIYDLSMISNSLAHDLQPYRVWSGFHTDRIVGLQWDPLDQRGEVLVTGANDNLVIIWNIHQDTPKHILTEHSSAVRALAFCPWQKNILATGGGNQDKHIRLFNSETGHCLKSIDVGSQVCGLVWSPIYKEMISAHSSESDQLIIWSYPSMQRIKALPGHLNRPLYLAISPDGQTLATASGDETLKFWKCFCVKPGQRNLLKENADSLSIRRAATIR